jgi:hypothetical protein
VSDANLILITGGLLIAGLLATIVAGRLRVPGLILFLGLGMAIGSDGTGWIDFDDYELARTIGVIALALILFEGGLSVGFGEIRPVLGASLALAIPGTLLTAAISGHAALAVRPLAAGGNAARLDRLGDRYRSDLRATAPLAPPPAGCALSRGRSGHERPGGGAPRRRADRLDPITRLWARGHGAPLRQGARHRDRGRSLGWLAVGAGAPTCVAGQRGRLRDRHDRHGGGGVRCGEQPAWVRLSGGLPRRPRSGDGADPGETGGHRLPSGSRHRRPGHDVRGSRTARLPVAALSLSKGPSSRSSSCSLPARSPS